MQEYFINTPLRPQSTCKVILSRIYFSKLMQMVYIFLILLCITSIILNFLIQADIAGNNYPAHHALIIMEVLICVIIILEISLRIYLQRVRRPCSLGNILDILITLMCIAAIIISLQNNLLQSFGSTTTDLLIVARSVIFLIRLVMVFFHHNETNVTAVKLAETKRYDLEANGLNELKVFKKYKPNMEVLLEEDEEESLSSQSAWKGVKNFS